MIKLHHLNRSRSHRILWLLEELGQPYEILPYTRDAQTNLAPPELRAVHPLGKSPMVELDGRLICESAAIVEVLCSRFAPDTAEPLCGPVGRGWRAAASAHRGRAGQPFPLYGSAAAALRALCARSPVGGGHHAEFSC